MKKLFKDNKGFSFPEMIMAAVIVAMVISVVISMSIIFRHMWTNGTIQVALQGNARAGMDMILRDIRDGKSANIFDSGDRIQIVKDSQTCEFDLNGTDIVFDPDISVADDSRIVVRNVSKISGVDLFQIAGNMVTVTFKSLDTTAEDGYQGIDISSSAMMRDS